MAEHVVLKLLIYLFNLILLLCGLALVVLGSFVQIRYKDYLNSLDGQVFIAPILLIAAGVIMVLVAAFGCFGTCKRLSWTLIVFAILLAIVFLLEIAGCIAAYHERGTVQQLIEKRMNDSMIGIARHNASAAHDQMMWDKLQRELGCCGVTAYKDWMTATGVVPNSCCKNETIGCSSIQAIKVGKCDQPGDIETVECPVYKKGCMPTAIESTRKHMVMVGGIGLGVAFFPLLGVCLAACLAKKIRRDGEL
ncbi:putative CD63 antigen [Hypsibius exemplaris]|uniref:Tetraspanin n=1 Tax=Hypsibius exemplaris TaxID=2072580 RepID=A0A1W0WTR8_HYPEX|nr:putative CD63 antigen [Hypsibius exemplaris]